MIDSYITIEDWEVEVLIDVDSNYDIGDILYKLYTLGCTVEQAKDAYKNLTDGVCNLGFTYSNYILKRSILFIGLLESDLQFMNTIFHESRHLQLHIANTYGLDENSENVCYLMGYIGQKIYEICKLNKLI